MARCPVCGHENTDTAKFCEDCGKNLDETMFIEKDPFIGTTIDGRYRVDEVIERGGMGTVYLATQVRVKKKIALKILHPDLARDKKFISRFDNEAVTVAGLHHENIVMVHDTGPVRDTYFIAMDFIEGKNLKELMEEGGEGGEGKTFSVDEAFDIAIQVAEGLSYAHKRDIIHRDIKPGNILVDSEKRVFITDFGIAKALGERGLTTTGTTIGTPEYMSYEQVKGKGKLDGRTDVYSLGVVLYEMLTGISPFRSDSGFSTIANVQSEEAEPIENLRKDLPEWAIGIVKKAMAKDRDHRFGSAVEFLEAVRSREVVVAGLQEKIREIEPEYPEDETPPEINETLPEETEKPMKKRRFPAALLIAIIAIILSVFSFYLLSGLLTKIEGIADKKGVGPYIPIFKGNPAHTGSYETTGSPPSGNLKWRFETGSSVFSSPSVVGGVVYVGSWDKYLYAMDASTGEEKWRFETGDFVFSSPSVVKGVVYVGSSDNYLYALNAVTGKEKWRFETGDSEFGVVSSPSVVNGVVYVGSYDNYLYAIDTVTGEMKWRFETGDYISSSPSVVNGIVYVGSADNYLYAIDAVTGEENWRFETGGGVESSPSVVDGVVYVGSNDTYLYAIDAVTGERKWRFETGGWVSSSPSVVNGVVYVGSLDTYLYAIDTVTGEMKWRFETGDNIRSSPSVVDSVVYVGSADNYLYALNAVTCQEKWRFETGDNIYSSPSVLDGVVYVGGWDGYLYAIE